MHEASYWKKEKDLVRCGLCQRECNIHNLGYGFCRVRQNVGNKLYSIVYARPAAINIDPIEKKPFYHFHPGTRALSLGTLGCNFRCKFCCNWDLSQAKINEDFREVLPEEIVKIATESSCQGIAYTYSEPTVFFEYALDCAKLAKEKGLYNMFVTNGYSMLKPLKDIKPFLDAVVIDFKGNNEDFYQESAMASLKEVKKGALRYKSYTNAFIEITNLIVPGKTDNPDELVEHVKWVAKHFGCETPYHLISFFPTHKMSELPHMPAETVIRLAELAREHLDFVYAGSDSTICPKCEEELVQREGFSVLKNSIKGGKCPKCGTKVNGFF
jgi:pyruvate formate lyase activating enzyme